MDLIGYSNSYMANRITHYKDSVYLFEIEDFLPDDFVDEYLSKLLELVTIGQPFGLIFKYNDGKPKKTKHGHRAEDVWLKAHRKDLSAYCYGIAIISNTSIFSLLQKIILKGAGEKLMGCKMELFFTLNKAEQWLMERMAI